MRSLRPVDAVDVWDHWRQVEGHTAMDFRSDVRGQLPSNLLWSVCEVQPEDIERLFVISSDDWRDVSGGTFRVAEVAARLDLASANSDTKRIADNIRCKLAYLDSGGRLDQKLVSVTASPSLSGPFTLLEGNRRSVAFMLRNALVGSSIFVGALQT